MLTTVTITAIAFTTFPFSVFIAPSPSRSTLWEPLLLLRSFESALLGRFASASLETGMQVPDCRWLVLPPLGREVRSLQVHKFFYRRRRLRLVQIFRFVTLNSFPKLPARLHSAPAPSSPPELHRQRPPQCSVTGGGAGLLVLTHVRG